MLRVPVKPDLLRWACERAGKPESALAERFSGFTEWLRGAKQPTFKQLEDFAKATRTPIGFFFLQKPPVENVPIPDFRTIDSAQLSRPSANLLDTIYLCQQRQDWFRQHALLMGDEPLRFIGSVSTTSDVLRTAAKIRASLDLDARPLTQARNADDAVGLLMARLDELGVLVMVSGIVGNNTHRSLDPGEFRGFALSDAPPHLAPLIFINGADTKSGQMFTLAHELAHLWLGESGVSDVSPASSPTNEVDRWCHAVATELVRAFDQARDENSGRGITRYVSPRFVRAVLASTWEGRSTFTEAFRLLGYGNVEALEALGQRLGMTAYLHVGAV